MAIEKPKFCSAAIIRFIKTRRSSPDEVNATWNSSEGSDSEYSQYTSVQSSQFWLYCVSLTNRNNITNLLSFHQSRTCGSQSSGSHKALDALWNDYLLIICWIRRVYSTAAQRSRSYNKVSAAALQCRYFCVKAVYWCVKACLCRTGLQIRRFVGSRVSYGKHAKFIFLRLPNENHDSPASQFSLLWISFFKAVVSLLDSFHFGSVE